MSNFSTRFFKAIGMGMSVSAGWTRTPAGHNIFIDMSANRESESPTHWNVIASHYVRRDDDQRGVKGVIRVSVFNRPGNRTDAADLALGLLLAKVDEERVSPGRHVQEIARPKFLEVVA